MDEIKRITKNELYEIASTRRFSKDLLAKDYVLTEILFLIKNIPNVYFKGGTALQKTILHHSRLSEDIDFTVTTNVKKIDLEIIQTLDKSKMFGSITHDKNVTGFIRIVVAYNLFGEIKGEVFIDLNEKADLLRIPENKAIEHFYANNIPKFQLNLLAEEELIAEKLRAGITRNKPRDHFDIYQILKTDHQINYKLAEEKCKSAGIEFSIIRLFNKAKTLKNRWDTDMIPLLAEEIEFTTVMRFLAKHFNLKEEKKKAKKQKN